MSNIYILYPKNSPRDRVRNFIAIDWLRTKKHISDAAKFTKDYWDFRQQGMSHRAAVINARNAL